MAALEKFYGWLVEEELIAASPFGSATSWRPLRNGGAELGGQLQKAGSKPQQTTPVVMAAGG